MKFDFSKSREDLQNKLQSNWLEIVNKNVLYLTHEIDQVKKIVTEIRNSANLQKQVDEYFDDSPQNIPEDDKEPD